MNLTTSNNTRMERMVAMVVVDLLKNIELGTPGHIALAEHQVAILERSGAVNEPQFFEKFREFFNDLSPTDVAP